MLYQISLEGTIRGRHAQLNFYDARTYREAVREAKSREHLPSDPAEEFIALLFSDKRMAIKDGVPRGRIETLRTGENPLYRYKLTHF